MFTPSMENYIEQIYFLMITKGYARSCDIAEALDVHPSSVTRMVKKLSNENYLVYEKYRGIQLTRCGEEIGEKLHDKHRVLKRLFHLIGVEQSVISDEVEGMKHSLGWGTIEKIDRLNDFLEQEKGKRNEAF